MGEKEQKTQDDAFDYYWNLGPNRSYVKVAMKFKKAIVTVERWGTKYKWQDRIKDMREMHQQMAKDRAELEKDMDYKQRNLKITRKLILEGAKQLQKGQMIMSPKILLEAMRDEERQVTGFDKKIEVNYKHDIKGLTNDQIREKIEERLNMLEDYKKLRTFDKEPDPVDVEFKEIKSDGN